jgi:hypothetical protein
MLTDLAAEAHLTPHQFRERFEGVVLGTPTDIAEHRACPVVLNS